MIMLYVVLNSSRSVLWAYFMDLFGRLNYHIQVTLGTNLFFPINYKSSVMGHNGWCDKGMLVMYSVIYLFSSLANTGGVKKGKARCNGY